MSKPKEPRPITAIDRMLSWSDGIHRALKFPIDQSSDRRRTHRRIGKLDLVVVEKMNKPTVVYLANDESVIIEASVEELFKVAQTVKEILSEPPPIKRRRK